MLDIKWVRENGETLDAALKARGAQPVSSTLMALDQTRRDVIAQAQELQSKRNELSKKIGEAKASGADAQPFFDEMKEIGPRVKDCEEKEREAIAALDDALAAIPNMPDADVPVGADEEDNVEVRTWGEKTSLNFESKHHYELGESLGDMDFETAATISGARFVWLQGDLARLERALGMFMLDLQTQEHGFTEVIPPMLVKTETMFGTGQLPKFQDDQYQTNDGRWMLPTAEVPLTNYAQGKLLKESDLPLKFCAWTPCFRKEAGSAGRDTRGYIRMHQFMKVEMVQIVHPEKSEEALEFMVNCAEEVLKRLEIPYRVITLCTGDLGFSARKTYDLEAWIPAQNAYREISSCSNCGDFQARRMKARFKDGNGKSQFVHTLNGSGLAVGRTLVAVMENYQQEDGSIRIPDVLQPYMGGKKVIEAKRA